MGPRCSLARVCSHQAPSPHCIELVTLPAFAVASTEACCCAPLPYRQVGANMNKQAFKRYLQTMSWNQNETVGGWVGQEASGRCRGPPLSACCVTISAPRTSTAG